MADFISSEAEEMRDLLPVRLRHRAGAQRKSAGRCTYPELQQLLKDNAEAKANLQAAA